MKSEHKFYIFALGSLAAGLFIAVSSGSLSIGVVSLIFAVGSGVWGRQTEQKVHEKQEIIRDLIQDKTELRQGLKEQRRKSTQVREELSAERQKKEELKQAKKRENQRLRNLKRVLRRKGIDTDYLINKYDHSLYAPVMVLTHFSAPRNNTTDDAEVIASNLEELDTKMLHGSARIVPPRNFDQSIRTKDELQDWFDEHILDNRTDIAHKLELISVVDIAQTFDRDATIETEGPDFKTNTVSALFENDTVVPTEDLLEILSRSEKISLEDELRGNIALLVVPTASETQMDQVLEAQQLLENELGEVEQIANTDTEKLEAVFAENGIENARELAEGVQEEAERLTEVLQ